MRLSWLLIFNAIVALLYALAALLVPGALYSFYGIASTAGTQFVMQLYGAALLMEALLTWQLRDIGPSPARQALTLALFAQSIAGLAVTLIAQLGGVMNSLGWAVVLLLLIFSVGYAYFRFVHTAPSSLNTPPAP